MQDERGGRLDRFATPLYSVAEAARYLDIPKETAPVARSRRARVAHPSVVCPQRTS